MEMKHYLDNLEYREYNEDENSMIGNGFIIRKFRSVGLISER